MSGFLIGFMVGWGGAVLTVTWVLGGRGGRIGRWIRSGTRYVEDQ